MPRARQRTRRADERRPRSALQPRDADQQVEKGFVFARSRSAKASRRKRSSEAQIGKRARRPFSVLLPALRRRRRCLRRRAELLMLSRLRMSLSVLLGDKTPRDGAAIYFFGHDDHPFALWALGDKDSPFSTKSSRFTSCLAKCPSGRGGPASPGWAKEGRGCPLGFSFSEIHIRLNPMRHYIWGSSEVQALDIAYEPLWRRETTRTALHLPKAEGSQR